MYEQWAEVMLCVEMADRVHHIAPMKARKAKVKPCNEMYQCDSRNRVGGKDLYCGHLESDGVSLSTENMPD